MGKLIISKSLVERVARGIHKRNDLFTSALLPANANAAVLAEAKKQALEFLQRNQPGLLDFFLFATEKFANDSKAVGLFLCEVIVETFILAGWAVRCIDAVEFNGAFEENHRLSPSAEFAQEKFVQQYLLDFGKTCQPELLHYLAGLLLDGDKETCPYKVPFGDFGRLFIALKSIVCVLDQEFAINLRAN